MRQLPMFDRALVAIGLMLTVGAIGCIAKALGWNGLHLQLGTIGEWLSAFFAAFAAGAALRIATRDRQDRIAERHETELAQAQLVRVRIVTQIEWPNICVSVENYSETPVLDVTLTSVSWALHPAARWGTNGLERKDTDVQVLRPESRWQPGQRSPAWSHSFIVWLMDAIDDRSLIELAGAQPEPDDIFGSASYYRQPDITTVTATIHFTDANGIRWERSNIGDPVRLA